MFLVFEETGELTQSFDITETIEEEFANGAITIVRIQNDKYQEYCGNGEWTEVLEREIF